VYNLAAEIRTAQILITQNVILVGMLGRYSRHEAVEVERLKMCTLCNERCPSVLQSIGISRTSNRDTRVSNWDTYQKVERISATAKVMNDGASAPTPPSCRVAGLIVLTVTLAASLVPSLVS